MAAVIASSDIDRLTMRDLAARLGVSHSALYRWVRDRDALFDLVGSVLVDRVVAEALQEGPLQARVVELGRRIRAAFLSVPGFASHLARPHHHSAHALSRLQEFVMNTFLACDIHEAAARRSWLVFMTTVVAALAAEERRNEELADANAFESFLDVLSRG